MPPPLRIANQSLQCVETRQDTQEQRKTKRNQAKGTESEEKLPVTHLLPKPSRTDTYTVTQDGNGHQGCQQSSYKDLHVHHSRGRGVL